MHIVVPTLGRGELSAVLTKKVSRFTLIHQVLLLVGHDEHMNMVTLINGVALRSDHSESGN